jgi:membrane-associated protease RseP (regulator of RpoE activity)
MIRLRHMVFLAVSIFLVTGCANPLHYGWAYVPLHDPKSEMFQEPQGDIEYRELQDMKAMVEAEREMYRKGYVMVGYSNMMSPQLEMIAASASRKWGTQVGASAVLHTFGRSHYLATFWAKPKRFVFGAYYANDLPQDARDALRQALTFEQGVIVESVVEGSPAFEAGVRPGDLLISLNNERIADAATLDRLLRAREGTNVTFVVWSMREGAPRHVQVALNPMTK